VQHRRIDAFTDSHPSVAAFRRVLTPEHGHYARVIADMFFDHFLACRFDEYAASRWTSFLARTFATIDPHVERSPASCASSIRTFATSSGCSRIARWKGSASR
jgi:acyl carrier protein phosphodiesterase